MKNLENNGCNIIGDNKIRKNYNNKIKKASIKDWAREYLAPIVSVKSVKNLDEAIYHINKYGTMHTDCIITQNKNSAKKRLRPEWLRGSWKLLETAESVEGECSFEATF